MAGNSQRKGAMRKTGSKKGPTAGSGGQRRRGLEPKGPTPQATERTKHPAARQERAKTKRAEAEAAKAPARGSGARGGTSVRSRKDGIEYVVGRNAVVEALRAGVPASALHVQLFLETDDRVKESLVLASEAGISLKESSRVDLDKLTQGAVHQGMALVVPPYEYAEPEDLLDIAAANGEAPLIVALDSITDPRNLGAIVRSAAAFGAHGVLLPERRAAGMTASAWKTSAGAAELAAGPLVVVVGSEGDGMSRLVGEKCDLKVGVPMTHDTESLNAGVAAGVVLYAVARSRRSRRTS